VTGGGGIIAIHATKEGIGNIIGQGSGRRYRRIGICHHFLLFLFLLLVIFVASLSIVADTSNHEALEAIQTRAIRTAIISIPATISSSCCMSFTTK